MAKYAPQPVRDAFWRLSQLGFLTIRPQRSTEVSAISERAVQQADVVPPLFDRPQRRHRVARHVEREGLVEPLAEERAQRRAQILVAIDDQEAERRPQRRRHEARPSPPAREPGGPGCARTSRNASTNRAL